MQNLKYIEYNNQPVISARDLYAFLTEGKGNNVTAWLTFCSDHKMMEAGEDYFEITTEGGHLDILMVATCATVMCSVFKNERAKHANTLIRNLILVAPPEELSFSTDKTSIDISDAAKILGVGQKMLFKLLREAKILMSSNVPYQNYVNGGFFKVEKGEYTDQMGNINHYAKALVTPSGIDFIGKIIQKSKHKIAA